MPTDDATAPDLDALFATPQIHTDDAGVHRDDAGRVHRAVVVGGETAYELAEEAQDES